jgi:hypothetical protein
MTSELPVFCEEQEVIEMDRESPDDITLVFDITVSFPFAIFKKAAAVTASRQAFEAVTEDLIVSFPVLVKDDTGETVGIPIDAHITPQDIRGQLFRRDFPGLNVDRWLRPAAPALRSPVNMANEHPPIRLKVKRNEKNLVTEIVEESEEPSPRTFSEGARAYASKQIKRQTHLGSMAMSERELMEMFDHASSAQQDDLLGK